MALSPMMQQYKALKDKYHDCLLFFRVGDFYEMFFEDALVASKELELTLTGKDCGLEERAPMCGVPHHAVTQYIERLVNKGFKVAIGEQMEDPATAKGLVDRDVIRIYTAGTLNDPGMLDEKTQCYLMSVAINAKACGFSYVDVSTGEFYCLETLPDSQKVREVLSRIQPSEVICNAPGILKSKLEEEPASLSGQPERWFGYGTAKDALCRHFGLHDLSPLGLDHECEAGVCAAGALMKYLEETQKNSLDHITHLQIDAGTDVMPLDAHTRMNLELTESIRTHSRKGSLLGLLDETCTAMGARMLKQWIEQPLTDRIQIQQRLDCVEELFGQHILASRIADELNYVYDLERLLSKVAYQSLNARDCLSLKQSLEHVPAVSSLLQGSRAKGLQYILKNLDPLQDLVELLERAIHPDPPVVISEGGIIRDGYNPDLDEYRNAAIHGKQWILDLEQKERNATGIRNLRIQYNKVFGYYIEVTKSFLSQVPDSYIRKQTLTNAERFMTPELKEMEQKIMGAQEQAIRLESQLFAEIRESILKVIERIQTTAQALKQLDALLSLARVAKKYDYCRPEITDDGVIDIIDGRHPVVEQSIRENGFVPNDTHMDEHDQRMLIITGPNMAGKSTYMRQVALITLMAHVGSFVPAQKASISVVDRIFTRVGASDDLAAGQSTFMVEMSETAYILKNATRKSLIILDEIGRGTSTFDGLAIAWAVVEHLVSEKYCGAKTLFATHYHELSELEGHLEGVQNYCISVKEHGEDVLFLRKIIRGGADKSFGIHVAGLAGIPKDVLVRAHEIQARLEVSDINQNAIGQNILGEDTDKRPDTQINMFDYQKEEIIQEIQSIDVMAMTPIDAMNKLFLLREKARKL